jgi:FMN reductase
MECTLTGAARTVVSVVGNLREDSRTLTVAEDLTARIAKSVPSLMAADCFDLAVLAERIFQPDDEDVRAAVTAVSRASVLVVASPTYKASYSGLLKAFFDPFHSDALRGVVAIPVMIGGSPAHQLAPDLHLRPLLVELGASTPTQSLYVLESQLPELGATLDAWVERNVSVLHSAPSCGVL